MNKSMFCSTILLRQLNLRKFRSKCLNRYAVQLYFFDNSNCYHQDCYYKSTVKYYYLCYSLLGIGFLFGGYILKKCTLKQLYTVNAEAPLLNDNPILDDKIPHSDKTSSSVDPKERFNFIADIVEKNAAALVCIEIEDKRRLYFAQVQHSNISGSGFIVNENGLILTNAHVILCHPNSIILVRLSNGDSYTAVVEDVDIKSDLATLRINPKKKLPVMKLGTSKLLRPGEWVVAMGSPLSLSNTITAGIVSSVSRTSNELGLHGRNMDYIQTDAAITFGNSGGPLVDLNGEVVGINSMKMSTGISFAIPIDYAKEFLNRNKKQLAGLNKKRRGYLGVSMLTLTNDFLAELQAQNKIPLNITCGVMIWMIVMGAPAQRSGLLPGDVIVTINGAYVQNVNDAYQAFEKYSALKLGVYRSGMYLEFTVYPENV